MPGEVCADVVGVRLREPVFTVARLTAGLDVRGVRWCRSGSKCDVVGGVECCTGVR